jgi:hypothetical protein
MSRKTDINKLNLENKRTRCHGKNCYTSNTEAQKVADEQEALNWNQNLKLKIYHCAQCGYYHLTRELFRDF